MKLRQRLHQWLTSRITPRDSVLLTQRNVYILPTPAGWMLALTLLVLLIASINYQLNLGYLLTFMLAGCAVVGMHVCHGNLRGLTLHLSAPEPQFAGTPVQVRVHLANSQKRNRYGIGLAVWDHAHWSWVDAPAQASSSLDIAFTPVQRGMAALPTLTAETRYPLGTFRVWTLWRPAAQVLVYPSPELNPPALPAGQPQASGAAQSKSEFTGEFDGVRAYRRGDPRKLIVWKKAAKNDTLVSRDAQHTTHMELWLDLAVAGPGARPPPSGGPELERALSRLCAWVLLAHQRNIRYGLRLGGQSIAPDHGTAHKSACLRALALL